MQPTRIAELLQPFLPEGVQLSHDDLRDISMYIDILQRWNARMNLTAIRGEEEIVTRHFGESLFVAAHLFPERRSAGDSVGGLRIADVGSGAGFPGIPIKLWARQNSATLIEANHKKATFLREVVRSLSLADIEVLNVRAEEVRQKFDFVTLRAVERFADILPVAGGLLGPSGRLALLIAGSQVAVASDALSLKWQMPIAIPQSSSRVLLVGKLEQGL
jgi:16S rRNA (guanine527-N7)-methyltransferase